MLPPIPQAEVPQHPTTAEIAAWEAERGYPEFGTLVGRAGDVDGDGVPDLLLGDSGFPDQGVPPTIWIASGKDGAVLRRVRPSIDESCYHVLEGGVEVDSDRVPDFLLASSPYSKPDHTRIQLFSGRTGSLLKAISPGGSASHTDAFARFVADADLDGRSDVGVLVLKAGEPTGDLKVYSSGTGKEVRSLPVENPCGGVRGSFIVTQDSDEDGVADVAVFTTGAERCSGRLTLYSQGKRTKIWECLSTTAFDTGYGALAILDDVDRDAVREIAVSFYDRVDILQGRNGNRLFCVDRPDQTDSLVRFGWRLAALQDIDGDKIADFAVSEIDSTIADGTLHAKSGADGHRLWEMAPDWDEDVEHLGSELAAVGDVDGDGITELLAGTWAGQAGMPGLARLISGRTGKLLLQFRRKQDGLEVERPEQVRARKR